MAEKKTVGQHLDTAIEKSKQKLHASKEFVKRKLKRKAKEERRAGNEEKSEIKKLKYVSIGIGILLLILIVWLVWPSGSEKATTEQAQSIAKMLKSEGVEIQGIQVTGSGYEVMYAAETAADRFDDAMLYDWATIFGVAANQRCERVSIVVTLDSEPIHKVTADCETIRGLARRVLTETEFWSLVKHESMA